MFAGLPDIARHNGSVYAVADRGLTRGTGDEDAGLSAFLRVMAAPSDRNRVTAYVDGGFSYAEPFGCKDDVMGLGFAVAKTSATTPISDVETEIKLGRAETAVEATYQA